MRRQEFKYRVQVVDVEVMEWFRKMMILKQKRKFLTKKEKDVAWKVLREREVIFRVFGNF